MIIRAVKTAVKTEYFLDITIGFNNLTCTINVTSFVIFVDNYFCNRN